jgi:hypothetical protein
MTCNLSVEIVVTAERIAQMVFHGAMDANLVRLLMKAGWPIFELPNGELACVPKTVAEHAQRVGYDPGHPERSLRPASARPTKQPTPVLIGRERTRG